MALLELKQKIKDLLEVDPYPLANDDLIDRLFGIDYNTTEKSLVHKRQEEFYTHQGLESQALNTSYKDFYQLGKLLPEGPDSQVFIDIGAGFARSKLLFSLFFPQYKVIAIEGVKERIEQAKICARAWEIDSSDFIYADLWQTPLPKGDIFFLYFPTGRLLFHLLRQLKKMALSRQITLVAIESHGDLLPTLEWACPWLIKCDNISSASLRHHSEIIVYRSILPEQMSYFVKDEQELLHDLFHRLDQKGSFIFKNIREKQQVLSTLALEDDSWDLIIEDQDVGGKPYFWSGSSKDLGLSIKRGYYHLNYPPREIPFQKIKGLLSLPPAFKVWQKARLEDKEIDNVGKVRKIILTPKPQIEFSQRGRLPLKNLKETFQSSLFQ